MSEKTKKIKGNQRKTKNIKGNKRTSKKIKENEENQRTSKEIIQEVCEIIVFCFGLL